MLGHPELFAGAGIEAENALVNARCFGYQIAQINLPVRNDRGRKTEADRRLPFWNQAGGWKGGEDARFGPGAVPVCPSPLRLLRSGKTHAQEYQAAAQQLCQGISVHKNPNSILVVIQQELTEETEERNQNL